MHSPRHRRKVGRQHPAAARGHHHLHISVLAAISTAVGVWAAFHLASITSLQHAAEKAAGAGPAGGRAARQCTPSPQAHANTSQPQRPSSIWPKPLAVSYNPATCSGPPLSLQGAALSVTVHRGFAAGARGFVAAAFRLAQANWGCHAEPQGGAWAGSMARGTLVSVVIANADCVTPDCYTEDSDESYTLHVSPSGVSIKAPSLFGVNWAFSTLAALSGRACALACAPLTIIDRPRLGHRGLLLDTSRNWFPVDDIKAKILDLMHLTKLNVFHWHVYDAQAQPLEVKFDRRLWQPYSRDQAYTQADARGLVDYAFRRGIRILPEFDMPGHTAALGRGDPGWVACGGATPWEKMCVAPPCGQLKPERVDIAVKLLREFMSVFPNRIVSTGADEVNFNCWHGAAVAPNSTAFPAFWASSVAKLAAFQTKVAAAVNAAGRTFAVWDESWETWKFGGTRALPRGSVLLNWRSNATQVAEATAAGYKVVVLPRTPYYLDCGWGPKAPYNWCRPLKTWADIWQFDLLAGVRGGQGNASQVIGGEVAMWSEHLRPALLDYIVWPRAAALGESLWSQPDPAQDLNSVRARLQTWMDQVRSCHPVRMSPLDWDGKDIKHFLLPQWCDGAPPQLNSKGRDYCKGAQTYAGVPLDFEHLVAPAAWVTLCAAPRQRPAQPAR